MTNGHVDRCSKFLCFCNEKVPEYAFRNFIFVGLARFKLSTNGLKEVVALHSPINLLAYRVVKMTVRLSVRLLFCALICPSSISAIGDSFPP